MMKKKDKIKELAKRELARRDFWHFCLYMDYDFFRDREKILKPIAKDMQKLVEGELKILNVSLPPRTGKSYLATLLSVWFLGHNVDKSIMRNSVTEILYRKFSNDAKDIINGKSHDGRFKNIFDLEFKTEAVDGWTLAGAKQNISYFGAGVGGSIIGFGADGLSILDDSVKNEEEAMSENALDKKWNWYTSTMDSRQEQGVALLFIGTRWAKRDIVGRLKQKGVFDKDDAKSIVVPALKDGQSYCEDIHTTESLLNKKELLPEVIWEAEWQQQPIESKGLVFPKDELNYFNKDKFNESNIDGIISMNDLADEGNDFLSFGILATISDKHFLLDVVHTQDKEEITLPIVADKINTYKPSNNHIEANKGGKGYKRELERLTYKGCHFNLFNTSKNKHTKIIMQSGYIRQHFYFREDYKPGSDYDKFMKQLTTYNKLGKVKHDDAADMVAMLSEEIRETSKWNQWGW
jgi:predicted phage terminase large subunit-like protein